MILNLMQIDRVTNRELKKTLAILEKTNAIDVFYFADFRKFKSKEYKKYM